VLPLLALMVLALVTIHLEDEQSMSVSARVSE
jgi:hypothetical protein